LCLPPCRCKTTPAAEAVPTSCPRVSVNRTALSHPATIHTSPQESQRALPNSCAHVYGRIHEQKNFARVFPRLNFRVLLLGAVLIATVFLRAVTCSDEQFPTCPSVGRTFVVFLSRSWTRKIAKTPSPLARLLLLLLFSRKTIILYWLPP